jgi:hypothetical protein
MPNKEKLTKPSEAAVFTSKNSESVADKYFGVFKVTKEPADLDEFCEEALRSRLLTKFV